MLNAFPVDKTEKKSILHLSRAKVKNVFKVPYKTLLPPEIRLRIFDISEAGQE